MKQKNVYTGSYLHVSFRLAGRATVTRRSTLCECLWRHHGDGERSDSSSTDERSCPRNVVQCQHCMITSVFRCVWFVSIRLNVI